MKFTTVSLSALAAALVMAGASGAQAQEGSSVSFNLGVVSDYVYRGVSQTDENPAIQGGVDYANGPFYAGIWGSNVDFGSSTSAEVDVYMGVTPTYGDVTFDFGAIYYGYIDSPSGSDEAFWEFKAAASVPVGAATLGAGVNYSPEFYGGSGEALYYEVNGAYDFGESGVSLSGALGYQDLTGGGDYTTWNLGLSWAFTPNLSLDLRYHDTDRHSFGKLYESRGVIGLTASF